MNREQSRSVTEWSPSRFFSSEEPLHPFALILLNQPFNWAAFERISRSASIILCADGGANWLYRQSSENGSADSYIPNAIVGDLDSLESDVETFYRNQGVAVVRDPDQYTTDFTKCLKWLRENPSNPQAPSARLDVVAIGGLGGRVDQAFSQIHHLYMATKKRELLVGEVYLLSEQSLSFVLEEGLNRIRLSRETCAENVGIIPITGPAVISTKGLEWDVQNWQTEFGGQLSTSNHLESEIVEIETTTRVLFTVELVKDLGVKVTQTA